MAEEKIVIFHHDCEGAVNHWSVVGELVRCKDCKHRIMNEHYGEKGYSKLKAMCELDAGDIFELARYAEIDDWFCADGERKDGGEK